MTRQIAKKRVKVLVLQMLILLWQKVVACLHSVIVLNTH